jgi:hypothetical protein
MPTLLLSGLLTKTNDGQSLYKIRERGLRLEGEKEIGFDNEVLLISLTLKWAKAD